MLHIKLKGNTYFVLHAPLTPDGVKRSNIFFSERKMLHIKLKGIEHRAPCMHIVCPYTHLRPLRWGQNIFTKSSHDAYQIKEN